MSDQRGSHRGLDPRAQGRFKVGSPAASFAGAGLQFAVIVVAFAFLGQWLDRRIGTGWITVVAVFLGATVGIVSMYRQLMAETRRNDARRNETRRRDARQREALPGAGSEPGAGTEPGARRDASARDRLSRDGLTRDEDDVGQADIPKSNPGNGDARQPPETRGERDDQ